MALSNFVGEGFFCYCRPVANCGSLSGYARPSGHKLRRALSLYSNQSFELSFSINELGSCAGLVVASRLPSRLVRRPPAVSRAPTSARWPAGGRQAERCGRQAVAASTVPPARGEADARVRGLAMASPRPAGSVLCSEFWATDLVFSLLSFSARWRLVGCSEVRLYRFLGRLGGSKARASFCPAKARAKNCHALCGPTRPSVPSSRPRRRRRRCPAPAGHRRHRRRSLRWATFGGPAGAPRPRRRRRSGPANARPRPPPPPGAVALRPSAPGGRRRTPPVRLRPGPASSDGSAVGRCRANARSPPDGHRSRPGSRAPSGCAPAGLPPGRTWQLVRQLV